MIFAGCHLLNFISQRRSDADMGCAMSHRPNGTMSGPPAPRGMLRDDHRNAVGCAKLGGNPAVGICEMRVNEVEMEGAEERIDLRCDAGEKPFAFQSAEATTRRR